MKSGPFIIGSSLAMLVACGEFGEGPAPATSEAWVSPGLERALVARDDVLTAPTQRKMFLLDDNPLDNVQKVALLKNDGSFLTQKDVDTGAVIRPLLAEQKSSNPFDFFTNMFAQNPPAAQAATIEAAPSTAPTKVASVALAPQVAAPAAVTATVVSTQVAPQSTPKPSSNKINWAAIFSPAAPEKPVVETIDTATVVVPKAEEISEVLGTPAPEPAKIASVKADKVEPKPAPKVTLGDSVEPASETKAPTSAPALAKVAPADDAAEASPNVATKTQPATQSSNFNWSELFAPKADEKVTAQGGNIEEGIPVTLPAPVVVQGQATVTSIEDGKAPATTSLPTETSTLTAKTEEPKTETAKVEETPALVETLDNFGSGKQSGFDLDRQWRNKTAVMQFSNGKLTGETECAVFTGKYERLTESKIRVTNVQTTLKDCGSDEVKAQSDNFIGALPGTYQVIIDGASMLMKGGSSVFQFSNI